MRAGTAITRPAGGRDPTRRAQERPGLARPRMSSAPRSPAARSRLRRLVLARRSVPGPRVTWSAWRLASVGRASRGARGPLALRDGCSPRRTASGPGVSNGRRSSLWRPPAARPSRLLRSSARASPRRRLPQPPEVTAEAAPRRRVPGRDGEHAPETPPASPGRCSPFAVALRAPRARCRRTYRVAARTRAGGARPGRVARTRAGGRGPGAFRAHAPAGEARARRPWPPPSDVGPQAPGPSSPEARSPQPEARSPRPEPRGTADPADQNVVASPGGRR